MTTPKQVSSRSKKNRVPFSDQSNVLRMQSRSEKVQETKYTRRERSARSRLLPNENRPIEQFKLQENKYTPRMRSARIRQKCKLPNTDELPIEQRSGVPSNPLKLKSLSVIIPSFDSKKVQKESNHLNQCQKPNKLPSRSNELIPTNIKESSKEPHVGSKVVQNPVHNLRQIKPTNYMEERSLSSTDERSVKENHVPIYRMKITENPAPCSKEELYDFIDTSPKMKKIVKNKRRSSILFDKNTYEILQRLQTKEEKSRKKALKKKRITYEASVNKIVSNVKKKILKNTGDAANKVKLHEATSKKPEVNKPRNNSNIINVNNFEKEFNITDQNLSRVSEKDESSQAKACCKIPKDVDKEVSDMNALQTRSLDTQDLDLIMLQSIGSCDNSVILRDLESGFGFSIDPPSTANSTSTPVKQVNILSNLVVTESHKDRLQSPVNFHMGNPNANSTMVQSAGNSTPWRTNWINIRRNPHLMSFKANALPNVEQEMVLDHTIVENYETHCSSHTQKPNCTPLKKQPVQKSILDFVENNIDKENEKLQYSLYDYEDFNSPEKKLQKQQRRIQNVRRKVLGEQNDIDQRSIEQSNLQDSIGEKSYDSIENNTYFGFDQSPSYSGCSKALKNDRAKPSRFDLSTLKKYTRKTRHLQQPQALEDSIASPQVNESVSMLENSTGSTTEDVREIHLFEEPEEMLDNMESVYEEGKRPRRKRLHSWEMDGEDQVAAKRKAKKTKLEIEQEAWIQGFNKMCEEIDSGDLIIE